MKELEEGLIENKNEIVNEKNLKLENNIIKENGQDEFLQSSLLSAHVCILRKQPD